MRKGASMGLCLAIVFLTLASPVLAGNFSQTCRNISVQGNRMTAECRRMNQHYIATGINLNMQIGNLNGVLSWGDHNFSQTCTNIRVDGAVLKASCRRINGSFNQTSLNLNRGINNTDGMLEFDRR